MKDEISSLELIEERSFEDGLLRGFLSGRESYRKEAFIEEEGISPAEDYLLKCGVFFEACIPYSWLPQFLISLMCVDPFSVDLALCGRQHLFEEVRSVSLYLSK